MKAVLVDIDAYVFQPGSEASGLYTIITALQQSSIPYLLITGDSTLSRRLIVEKLQACDIEVTAQEVLTPTVACAQWLCERGIERISLMLPRHSVEDFVGFENCHSEDHANPQAVVMGNLGKNWNYTRLNQAFRSLMQSPRPVLATLGMMKYRQEEDGLALDIGPFAKALEFASDCDVHVVGKPSETFFEEALHILKCEPADCTVISDDAQLDIQGALALGMEAYLVRAADTSSEVLRSQVAAERIVDSVAQVCDLIK